MILSVSARYLWLPICKGAEPVKLHFYAADQKFQEADVCPGTARADYYAPMDLGRFIGQEIGICGSAPEGYLEKLTFHDSPPEISDACRPQLHFTAETGWINDPNGLVYDHGMYHLFYQWNPYGTEWGNMHWGHAVSRDLMTWEHRGIALEPDIYGTVYSGCGWPDRENTAGFGKDALLFYYTASGGRNQWSADAGNRHAQRLAVSTDGGGTLEKKGLILDHIIGENRDPKVFRHEESHAYIMALYLEENDFAVFRSTDLLHWTESQRFTAEGMWECPDLFELPVENRPGETRWVFSAANGAYLVGRFDGFRFTPEQGIRHAYDTALPYAAQTYAGTEDRKISIAWLRTRNDRGHFRGMMSIPMELTLVREDDFFRIRLQPVRELRNRLGEPRVLQPENQPAVIALQGKPALVKIEWAAEHPEAIRIGDAEIHPGDHSKETMILLDHGIIEYFDRGGLAYWATEAAATILREEIRIPAGAARITVFEFAGS